MSSPLVRAAIAKGCKAYRIDRGWCYNMLRVRKEPESNAAIAYQLNLPSQFNATLVVDERTTTGDFFHVICCEFEDGTAEGEGWVTRLFGGSRRTLVPKELLAAEAEPEAEKVARSIYAISNNWNYNMLRVRDVDDEQGGFAYIVGEGGDYAAPDWRNATFYVDEEGSTLDYWKVVQCNLPDGGSRGEGFIAKSFAGKCTIESVGDQTASGYFGHVRVAAS